MSTFFSFLWQFLSQCGQLCRIVSFSFRIILMERCRKKTKCLMLKKIQNFYLAENRPSARLWAISGQSLECWTSAHHSYPLIFNQRWFSQHSDIFLQLFFARTKLLYFLLFNTCNKRWYYTIVQCIHCLVCVFVWSWLRREKLKYF